MAEISRAHMSSKSTTAGRGLGAKSRSMPRIHMPAPVSMAPIERTPLSFEDVYRLGRRQASELKASLRQGGVSIVVGDRAKLPDWDRAPVLWQVEALSAAWRDREEISTREQEKREREYRTTTSSGYGPRGSRPASATDGMETEVYPECPALDADDEEWLRAAESVGHVPIISWDKL
eukprot:TRINITY_DN74493_c0_g1_i1.p1 TRINITY_DN74493_c0_g1~~TRINITY_DN74493_c0_g1_i1.p1  ORF type:complete len:177 (-),score=29.53 TRINITY_DN74493_c0_g1_i1:254-784(-)